MNRKLLLLFIMLSAAIVIFPNFAYAQTSTDNWVDHAATEFAGGTGTEADPFQIETPAQLAYMAQRVNSISFSQYNYTVEYYELSKDINISAHLWIPIGNESDRAFPGVFDGNNNTITGLTMDDTQTANQDLSVAGLFGYTAMNFTIRDLNLSDVDINMTGATVYYIGGLVANSSSARTALISNITVSGEISGGSSTSRLKIGGIIGYSSDSNNRIVRLTMSDITNNASVHGTGSYVDIGGIAGAMEKALLSGCINNGNISSLTNDRNRSIIGGLIGYSYSAYNGDATFRTYVYNSSNSGTVTANVTNAGGNVRIGGLTGSGGSVYNCYNEGDLTVSATGTSENTDPIMGGFSSQNGSFYNCLNTGTMSILYNGAQQTAEFRMGLIGLTADVDLINSFWPESYSQTLQSSNTDGLGRFDSTGVLTGYDGHSIIDNKTNIVDALNAYVDANSDFDVPLVRWNGTGTDIKHMTHNSALYGTVTDSDDNNVDSATVTLTTPDGGKIMAIAQAVTNSDGVYRFNDIIPGSYAIIVEAEGRLTQKVPIKISVFNDYQDNNIKLINVTPFENNTISTIEHLAYLSQQVSEEERYTGEVITLSKDLDLADYNWTPIGTDVTIIGEESTHFEGYLDGAGYSIKNMNVWGYNDSLGLFSGITMSNRYSFPKNGRIGAGDITFYNPIITGTTRGAGVLAGAVKVTNTTTPELLGDIAISLNNITVINPQIHIDVTDVSPQSSIDGIGGLVGSINSGCIVDSCTVQGGTVISLNHVDTPILPGGPPTVGGIVGTASKANIISSSNSATVIGQADVGGILGIGSEVRLDGNTNSGSISEFYIENTSYRDFTEGSIGGILGFSHNDGAILKNNINTGDIEAVVSSDDHDKSIGGIVGDFSVTSSDFSASIYNNYSTGNVNVEINSTSNYSSYGIGGAIGKVLGGNIHNNYITKAPTITGSAAVTTVGAFAGYFRESSSVDTSTTHNYAMASSTLPFITGEYTGLANGTFANSSGIVTALSDHTVISNNLLDALNAFVDDTSLNTVDGLSRWRTETGYNDDYPIHSVLVTITYDANGGLGDLPTETEEYWLGQSYPVLDAPKTLNMEGDLPLGWSLSKFDTENYINFGTVK